MSNQSIDMKDCGMIKSKLKKSDSTAAGIAALFLGVVIIFAGTTNGKPDLLTTLLMLLAAGLLFLMAWILFHGQ